MFHVGYSVDLVSSFNRAFSDKPIVVKAALRPMLSKIDVKQTIGQAIIDKIIERTREKNIDKNNKPFPAYSKSYMKSLRFKIYNKTPDVNLTLTKEMLSSMVVKSKKGAEIEITMADQQNQAKAHGNIYGTYGRKKSTGKRRDFLGLPKKDLDEIVRSVVVDASSANVLIDSTILSGLLANQYSANISQLDQTNILAESGTL